MNYNIEKVLYTEDDNKFVYNVKKDAYKNYVEENWGIWDEHKQRELFKDFLEEYKKELYIIKLNNERIGFYHGEILANGDYEIGNICIIPKYQGKGIGTKILKDILEKYKNNNILLQYFKQNPVGNLYLRLGFELYDETDYHYKMVKRVKLKECE